MQHATSAITTIVNNTTDQELQSIGDKIIQGKRRSTNSI